MSIDLPNGAVVSRLYSDGSGELLAQFQYASDADDWAARKVEQDRAAGMSKCDLYRTCLYSGKLRRFSASDEVAA